MFIWVFVFPSILSIYVSCNLTNRITVAKPKEKKADDGTPKRLTRVKYIDPLSDLKPGQAQLQRRLQVLKSIKSANVMAFRGYQEVDGDLWYMSDYLNKRSVLDESHWLGRPMKEDECCQVQFT